MRILFLTHAFNSLTQRLYVELSERGHEISVEFDINDLATSEAVALYQPDLILAPFLKRAIPETVWRRYRCLVVHPGIKGDRGPSALDWAIMNQEHEWGVTVLQANADMDGGDIWSAASFAMREAPKSSIYRHEVTEAAVVAVVDAIRRIEGGTAAPEPLDYSSPEVCGRTRPLLRQVQRLVDWQKDDTQTVMRKIRAADGFPGVEDALFGQTCRLFDAWEEGTLRGASGAIIARRDGALCRATRDGAVWIGHVRLISPGDAGLKLPATFALRDYLEGIPMVSPPADTECGPATYREISYREKNGVGYLEFEFYNGAMSSEQCQRLLHAYRAACERQTRVIVLLGGSDFWSNGINLNTIEAAESPADESWKNINSMNDLACAIINTQSHLTISALRSNAGAGGVFLALAADKVYVRDGVVLNPHYKGMGNLYGSEYWTYLLPKRVGSEKASAIMENRLPVGARAAARSGLVDAQFAGDAGEFLREVQACAESFAASAEIDALLEDKRRARREDEALKPLEKYRAEELARMKLNFYGFDPSYHVARYHFVFKVPHSWTPLHLARHRRLDWLREMQVNTGGEQAQKSVPAVS